VRRLEHSFASGQSFEEEMRIRRADGIYRWFLTRAVPIQDKHGKVLKWYGTSTDIEDRKHAEQLQAELAHVSRVNTMGELAASISHDLNQPRRGSFPAEVRGALIEQYLQLDDAHALEIPSCLRGAVRHRGELWRGYAGTWHP
jgi:hypothetical protein